MNIQTSPRCLPLLFTSCEKETELERIKREASQGDAEAQLGLAIIYDTIDGLPEYKADAVKWCRMAAEQGHAGAQYYLGGMYAKGSGVSKDDSEAVKWFRKRLCRMIPPLRPI